MNNTKISWCHHTKNFWRGCQKVSPGCDACYAEAGAVRNPKINGIWGPDGTRVVADDAQWDSARHINDKAKKDYENWKASGSIYARPERPRIFCFSIADVFEQWNGIMSGPKADQVWYKPYLDRENERKNWTIDYAELDGNTDPAPGWRLLTMDDIRQRLFDFIRETPYIDWLLLTKRTADIVPTLKRMRGADGWKLGAKSVYDEMREKPWPNVWFGTTVENQEMADLRIPFLLEVPAICRFISVEPMLGPVSLSPWMKASQHHHRGKLEGIHWVICGGESHKSPKLARPMSLGWVKNLMRDAIDGGSNFFMKQLGNNPVKRLLPIQEPIWFEKSGKGDTPGEWPEEFRVHQVPVFDVAV